MIEVKDLKKSYDSKDNPFWALKGVSLKINKGESVAIVGKSGSGKSTLMHLMAGLDTPTSGKVLLNDVDISKMNKKQLAGIRNKNYGFIFQQFFLMPKASVLENVILPLKIAKLNRKERTSRGLEALKEVDLLDKKSNKGTDLSGGQKQRVAVARALVTNPEIIFADEPTGNLDSVTGKQIEELLFRMNKEKGITLILVTHDEDLAKKCDKQIQIKDGLIIKG